MGYGRWTRDEFREYNRSRGRKVAADGTIAGNYTNQEMFRERGLHDALNPFGIGIRECRDSEDHPNTLPVILALDVTGSMGQAAVEVAKKLNLIMTDLYKKVEDVEFMIMGIGDLEYDRAPIQISQFEADIRIADQLDKLYFEFGGGGNFFESYTAAWYMGALHTDLDCWKRGKKGIIITIGDEQLNPYLPVTGRKTGLMKATGDQIQTDVNTADLYGEVVQKYDLYHLNVIHDGPSRIRTPRNEETFREYLGQNYQNVEINHIADTIVDIITGAAGANRAKKKTLFGGIAW